MKLEVRNSKEYFITNKRDFLQITIEKTIIKECFDFAYEMVFGEGHHRKHRSGGQYGRKNGELFANTFQGKIAEFVVYNEFIKKGLVELEKPDMGIYSIGIWDDTDLNYKGIKINVKSAAFFSNLLLLESKDWNKHGEYIPNIGSESSKDYDYFILVRIKPDIKRILRFNKLLFSNGIKKAQLMELVFNENWFFDFAGVCSQLTIKHIIKHQYFLPQNSLLNGKIAMDADNYYIQSGDLKTISVMINKLKQL